VLTWRGGALACLARSRARLLPAVAAAASARPAGTGVCVCAARCNRRAFARAFRSTTAFTLCSMRANSACGAAISSSAGCAYERRGGRRRSRPCAVAGVEVVVEAPMRGSVAEACGARVRGFEGPGVGSRRDALGGTRRAMKIGRTGSRPLRVDAGEQGLDLGGGRLGCLPLNKVARWTRPRRRPRGRRVHRVLGHGCKVEAELVGPCNQPRTMAAWASKGERGTGMWREAENWRHAHVLSQTPPTRARRPSNSRENISSIP
jgi:hypothetical protein